MVDDSCPIAGKGDARSVCENTIVAETHAMERRTLVLVASPTSLLIAIRAFLLQTAKRLGVEDRLRSRLLDAMA